MNVFGFIFYQFVKDNILVFCTCEIKSVRMIRKNIPVHFDIESTEQLK